MKKQFLFTSTIALAIAALSLSVTAAHADSINFNATPADSWLYGTGNGYTPANTEVLTTGIQDQLYLRLHETGQVASASVGNVYSFALSPGRQVSFDWGFDLHNNFNGPVTALITLTNLAGGSYQYNTALGFNGIGPNDNYVSNGSTQNSARLNWTPPAFNFNPNANGTYKVNLTVTGLDGGTKSLDAVAKIGDGFSGGAVPEPASWALMLLGFGGIGAMLRSRRRLVPA